MLGESRDSRTKDCSVSMLAMSAPPYFPATSASSSWAPSARALWALLITLTILWFATLDARRLVHPDEGRYAEIAREMAATGDWVTPRLNGLKYFEKPPLQYWLTAAAYRVFGVHEWTARLWPALAGFLAVLALGAAGYALGGVTLGAYAALVLATTLWHAGIAQIVTLDSGLSFFLAVGFSALVIAQRAETGANARRTWMWVASAALAGATLSKGLIGIVLPGGALVVYTALTRDFAVWRRLHVASGLAVYLALTAPWFVAVSRANDEFARFFFIHEHFERFLTTGHARPGPWYYFVPWFAAGMLPWLLVLAWGVRRAWRDGTPNALGFSWQRFALSWAAFVFLFFSASGSKLQSYILPMFPPLALVTAFLLVRLEARTLLRLMLPLVAAGSAAGARPRRCLRSLCARLRDGPYAGRGSHRFRRVPQGGSAHRCGRRHRRTGGVSHWRLLAKGTVRGPDRTGVDGAGRPASRHCRLRQVEPDALVLGYPPVCAASCGLRRRRALLSDRDVRSNRSLLSPSRRRASSPTATNWRWASTPNRRSRCRRWRHGSPSGSRSRKATRSWTPPCMPC